MPTHAARPADAVLRRYLRGTLAEDEVPGVEAWMHADPHAAAVLDGLDAADPLADALAETPSAVSRTDTEVQGPAPTATLAQDAFAGMGTDPPPARIGVYDVVRELGRGGMGVVYEVEDRHLGRRLAVKVMSPRLAGDPEARARFTREARAQAALEHDHVVAIHLVGLDQGVPFIAMPLLRGATLADEAKEKSLPLTEAVRIGREVAEGLAAAHERGLIHRDIKPGNIWLEGTRRRVKILDFGLARPAPSADTIGIDAISQSGAVVGTPAFMSPEQARGQSLDARSDLFSLGVVLYRLLTGQLPFEGEHSVGVMHAVISADPIPPRKINPDIPPELETLVLQLLQKDAARRPASAELVAGRLRQFEMALDRTIVVPASPISTKPPRQGRPRWMIAAGIAAFLILLSVVIIKIRDKDGKVIREIEYDPDKGERPEFVYPPPAARPDGPSPFDKLDAKAIPAEERFAWQPKELVAVIGSHRQRLEASILGIACSPDGKQVFSYVEGEARRQVLWDAESRKRVGEVENFMCHFTADGKYLIGNRTFDLSGAEPRKIGDGIGGVALASLSFSSDDKLALVSSHGYQKYCLLYDMSDPAKPKQVAKVENASNGCVSPDGKIIAVQGDAYTAIRLYDWNGKVLTGRKGVIANGGWWTPSRCSTVFVAPNRLGVVHRDGIFRLWDVGGAEPKTVAETPKEANFAAYQVVASRDGKLVALNSEFSFAVWKRDGDRLTKTSTGDFRGTPHINSQSPPAFLDDKTLVTGHLNGSIGFWDISQAEAKLTKPIQPNLHVDKTNGLAVSRDGKTLVSSDDIGRVRRYAFGNADPREVPFENELSQITDSYRFSPDARHVRCFDKFATLTASDAKWLELPPTARSGLNAESGTYSRDSRNFLLFDGVKQSIAISAVTDDQFTLQSNWAKVAGKIHAVHLFNGGKHAMTHTTEKFALWTNENGKLAETDSLPADTLRGWTSTVDGKTLLICAISEVRPYSIAAGKLKAQKPIQIGGDKGYLSGVCLSGDDKRMAICGGTLHVIERESGKVLYEHPWRGAPRFVMFAPDDRHLLVHNVDGTLYVLRLPAAGK